MNLALPVVDINLTILKDVSPLFFQGEGEGRADRFFEYF
jgi:hypothetical protein